jgi:murein DD-endopeptidase MepM/ murein hydrolase activator NlpD
MADWQTVARRMAHKYGIDPNVFVRQINQESGGRDVRSPAGAQGPAQFMPGTAASVGLTPTTVHQLGPSLDAAARLMASYTKKFGSYKNALIAYNAGPGAVGRGSLPAETQNYIKTILDGSNPSPVSARAASAQGGRSTGSTTTNLPGATFKTTVPTVDQSAFEGARRNAIIGQLIARRNPNSILLRSGLLSTVEPSLTEFMGQQTTTSRVPGKTVTVPGVAAAAPAGGIDPRAKPGVPVAHLSSEGGTHPTAGLAGFPARDYFAKPGTAAVAPVNGKVVRLSGHDPAQGPTQGPHGPLGWSVYIQGNDGHTYFLTHMGTRNVKPGQRVRAGQRIGTVANYDKYGTPSHIHMGVH